MKIIILGHTGFIGNALLEHFLGHDVHEVIGYSLPDINLIEWDSAKKIAPDLTEEATLIFASAIKRQVGDDIHAFKNNISMTLNICKLLAENPVKKVIYLSSAAVYGEDVENLNITEDTLVHPNSYYGIAKYTSERLLEKTCTEKGIKNFIAVRPPVIYGIGDFGFNYGPAGFLQKAKISQPIILWGDGTEKREFIYISDVCRIFEKLLILDFFGPINIVSGISYDFAEIINILLEWFPNIKIESRPRTKLKVNHKFDPSLLTTKLDLQYNFISLRDGISKMVNLND